MEDELRAALLDAAKSYATISQCALSTVSRRCRGDAGFFSRIAQPGNSFTARTFDEAMEWFAKNWPEDEDLPASLRRYLTLARA